MFYGSVCGIERMRRPAARVKGGLGRNLGAGRGRGADRAALGGWAERPDAPSEGR